MLTASKIAVTPTTVDIISLDKNTIKGGEEGGRQGFHRGANSDQELSAARTTYVQALCLSEAAPSTKRPIHHDTFGTNY